MYFFLDHISSIVINVTCGTIVISIYEDELQRLTLVSEDGSLNHIENVIMHCIRLYLFLIGQSKHAIPWIELVFGADYYATSATCENLFNNLRQRIHLSVCEIFVVGVFNIKLATHDVWSFW